MTHHSPDDECEHGQSTQPATITYDVDETERPSMTVVQAVASLTNTPVLDLDPLFDIVDPKHIDELFEGKERDSALEECSITFRFNGCLVTLTQETIRVREDTGDSD